MSVVDEARGFKFRMQPGSTKAYHEQVRQSTSAEYYQLVGPEFI